MKLIAVFFAVLLGSVSALPKLEVDNEIRPGQERLGEDLIAGIIEIVIQNIIDAGLDPLVIAHADYEYALPVPSIFNMRANVRDLLFRGISNLIINDLNVNVLTLRVTFNVGMPEILLNVVDSELDANLFDAHFKGRYSGRVVLQNIEVTGNVRISIGIISGISVSEMDITFSLGNIDSQLNLSLQGNSYSDALNTFLGQTLPKTLTDYESDINTLISIVAKQVVESIL